MRLKVDQQADTLYLTLSEQPAARTEEIAPGILVDYDAHDHMVGIEVLYLSKRAPQADLRPLILEFIPKAPLVEDELEV